MTEQTPIGKTSVRSGQVAIITIGLIGMLFFGGMELLKRQIHSTPATPVSKVVVLPAKVLGSADMNYLTDAVPRALSTLFVQVQGLEDKGAAQQHRGRTPSKAILRRSPISIRFPRS